MNRTTITRAEIAPTTPPAVAPRATAPATGGWMRALPQRSLSVWDERARKMGFPPSAR
ncbi:MAG TPA: hypothetical protein VML58_13235 [Burkholderiaceae bacterium]|nr:hypothetical protein [Burkholderiaceae bacterium]